MEGQCKYCTDKATRKSYRQRGNQVSSEVVCQTCHEFTNEAVDKRLRIKLAKLPPYMRVVQMGFDIAVRANGEDDLSNLFSKIEDVINGYVNNTKAELNFKSVGCDNTEDMSHGYGDKELKLINKLN